MPETLQTKLAWSRIHTLVAVAIAVLGAAVTVGANIALSKAELDNHATRLTAVESSAGLAAKAVLDLATQTAVHNAMRDQQLDTIREAVSRIEDKLDTIRVDGRRYRTVYAPAKK